MQSKYQKGQEVFFKGVAHKIAKIYRYPEGYRYDLETDGVVFLRKIKANEISSSLSETACFAVGEEVYYFKTGCYLIIDGIIKTENCGVFYQLKNHLGRVLTLLIKQEDLVATIDDDCKIFATA